MIVVDASVLATALGDDGPDGDRARARLRGERLNAPELVDLEVASVLRRQVQGGEVNIRRAALALTDLAAIPLRRAPHRPLLARCWELRGNLTIYDASYVALAEALEVTLLTGDGRLACAPGPLCHVEMLRSASLSRRLQASRHAADSVKGCRARPVLCGAHMVSREPSTPPHEDEGLIRSWPRRATPAIALPHEYAPIWRQSWPADAVVHAAPNREFYVAGTSRSAG